MIGTVRNSYIKGNSIHRTYNRAITFHGVHYLKVTENIAYDTKGHTFFIEDGIETKNLLEHNLALLTQRSWSLLNTDQSPASFWITNPDNIFKNNHAGGSDRYGFWFDLKVNPTGPSADSNVFPIYTPLGEFSGNVAHSNVRYGLRVFHGIIPRSDHSDPTTTIPSTFENFLGYKNGRNGAIFEKIGGITISKFTVTDNILGGIEVSLTGEALDGDAVIDGALVVGHSANADDETLGCSAHGIITARTENF
jgi:hypothetical protein